MCDDDYREYNGDSEHDMWVDYTSEMYDEDEDDEDYEYQGDYDTCDSQQINPTNSPSPKSEPLTIIEIIVGISIFLAAGILFGCLACIFFS